MKEDLLRAVDVNDTDWFREVVGPHPDPSKEFTLAESTYEKIYGLAARIYGLAGTSICLCSDDKALYAAAVIAALAGGPRLILPHAFSRQALTEVADCLAPSLFLTDGPRDFPAGYPVVDVSSLPSAASMPTTVRDPDETFLVLFTGGSTGSPKIWPKTPRNMLAEARYQVEAFGITEADLLLSTVPPNHIYGLLFSVLVPLVSGARILPGIYTFPREILRMAEEYKATALVSVPVHYRILKTDGLQRFHLRLAFSSAGLLDEGDALFFREKTGVDVTEVYGSTETGGVATRRRAIDGGSWIPMSPIEWKIREERLCVRSAFLSPTLERDGEDFFIMADCAEPCGEDRFIFRGRQDDIVKIGGKRVDMGAVRAKLKAIPGVSDAVVISVPVRSGRQNELAALVAAVPGLDAAEVRRQMVMGSEAYAVPKRIAVTDAIPMTPSGKYDRGQIERVLQTQKKGA